MAPIALEELVRSRQLIAEAKRLCQEYLQIRSEILERLAKEQDQAARAGPANQEKTSS